MRKAHVPLGRGTPDPRRASFASAQTAGLTPSGVERCASWVGRQVKPGYLNAGSGWCAAPRRATSPRPYGAAAIVGRVNPAEAFHRWMKRREVV